MLKRRGIIIIMAELGLFIALVLLFKPEDLSNSIAMPVMGGGIAFLLMINVVILTTRLSFLENLFGGLDRMYQVHRYMAVALSVLVLLHFFTAPEHLPEGADPLLNAIAPSKPMGLLAMILLILGMFVALNRKIAYSTWRKPHKLMALVYVLVMAHMMTAPPAFFDRSTPYGIFLIIMAIIGLIAVVYSLFGLNRRTALPYTIIEVNKLERATELVLKAEEKPLKFQAGQFAFLEIEGKGWNEPHPFTISSQPDDEYLRFTIKVLGDWTRKVRDELEAGKKAKIRGAYGRFLPQKSDKPQVWIAGGIGITPFLSNLRDFEPSDSREVNIFYATRDEQEAIYFKELKLKAEQMPNVKIWNLHSDNGEFVTVELLKEKLENALLSYDFYLCGPKPMLDAVKKGLKSEAVQNAQIHTEAFEFR